MNGSDRAFRPIVEACVVSAAEGVRAVAAGADRLELCHDLSVGGVSPSPSEVRELCDRVPVPVLVMVRPRPGPFVLRPGELDRMTEEVDRLTGLGAAGVVVGALTDMGELDLAAVAHLVERAREVEVTFHRAFDVRMGSAGTEDPSDDVRRLAELGVRRILTGGGDGPALDHLDVLSRAVAAAPPSLDIVVAGGVRADHVRELVRRTGAQEVHARAEAIPDLVTALT